MVLSGRGQRRDRPDGRHGPRVLRGQGDVPGQVRRGVRGRRAERAGLRQPQLRRQRRHAPAGDRPLGPGARLPARHHLLEHAAWWPGPSTAGSRPLDFIEGFREQFDADRMVRFHGKEPAMVPVVAEDPLAPSALPTPDSWQWFAKTGKIRAPNWKNEVTLRTVEMLGEYNPAGSPSPPTSRPRAQEAGHPARRPLRRLRQELRRLQRPGPGLVPRAPHGLRGGRQLARWPARSRFIIRWVLATSAAVVLDTQSAITRRSASL